MGVVVFIEKLPAAIKVELLVFGGRNSVVVWFKVVRDPCFSFFCNWTKMPLETAVWRWKWRGRIGFWSEIPKQMAS